MCYCAVVSFSKIDGDYASIEAQGGVQSAIDLAKESGRIKGDKIKGDLTGTLKEAKKKAKEKHESIDKLLQHTAEGMAEGSLSKEVSALDQFSSLSDYANAVGATSAEQAGKMKATAKALRKTGMIDKNGNLTSKAEDAMRRADETSDKEMLGKSSFLTKKPMMKHVLTEMINRSGLNEQQRKKALADMVKDGFISKANAEKVKFNSQGKAIESSVAPSSADDLAMAIGSSEGDKMGANMKSMIINGYAVKIHGGSLSAIKDNSQTITTGKKFNANVDGVVFHSPALKRAYEILKH